MVATIERALPYPSPADAERLRQFEAVCLGDMATLAGVARGARWQGFGEVGVVLRASSTAAPAPTIAIRPIHISGEAARAGGFSTGERSGGVVMFMPKAACAALLLGRGGRGYRSIARI